MSETPRSPMGPHNQPSKSPIHSEIGESIDGFAARIETLLKTQEGTIEAEHNSVRFQVKPGMSKAEIFETFKKARATPPVRRTLSGLEILSPAIGENSEQFLRSAFDRAVRENVDFAIETHGITFEVRPQERKVIFGRVNYHLDKRPITFEDVMRYLQAASSFRRR